MASKRTVVLGASTNPSRYSNMAVKKLLNYEHEVFPIGIRKGEIEGLEILSADAELNNIHTVTLYIGPQNQPPYYDYILSLKPKRVIFNPGTINPKFMEMLSSNGVEVLDACTLVMLSSKTY